MQIHKLSASSYKTWDFCQQKFFIGDVLKYRFPAGKAANIGTCTHEILEILARLRLAQQQDIKSIKTNIGQIDRDNFDINDITDRVYENFIKNPELKHLNWENKDYKTIKKYINKAITHNDGYFNPLNREIIATEQYINLEIKENWAILPDHTFFKITGFIDLITKCKDNCIEITDWKSGNPNKDFLTDKKIDEDYLKNDIQLLLYHYACSRIYGYDKNYLITLFFLQKGPITISFSKEDAIETEYKIKDKFIEIYKTRIPKLNRSFKCRFCEYANNTLPPDEYDVPIQFLDNQISNIGEPMCLCDITKFETDRRGIAWVQDNLKNAI